VELINNLKNTVMKNLETLTEANQIKSEESQSVYVSDCSAHVWIDKTGTYFCASKDGIHNIRRKTFNAIWNYLYQR